MANTPTESQNPPYVEKAVAPKTVAVPELPHAGEELHESAVEQPEPDPDHVRDERRVVAAEYEGGERERRQAKRRRIGGGNRLDERRRTFLRIDREKKRKPMYCLLGRELTPARRSGLEVVRVVRERLRAALGHEHEVLEPAAAPAAAVEPGLERDDVSGQQFVACARQARLLVNVEADAGAERVEVPALDDFPGLLVQHRLVTGAVEGLARDGEDFRSRRAGAHRLERAVERLLDEPLVVDELLRRLADAVRARHVREAGGLGV